MRKLWRRRLHHQAVLVAKSVAGDISRRSPGVNVGESMDFVDNCYLMHHTPGWLLWDTGVTQRAIAAMPDGQAPADPRANARWRRPKTSPHRAEFAGCKALPTSNMSRCRLPPILITSAMSRCFLQAMFAGCRRQSTEWPLTLRSGASGPNTLSGQLGGATAMSLAMAAWRLSRRRVIRRGISPCL